MFLILKFCKYAVIFGLFISNTFASEVERVRNIANSKSFIEVNKTATELAQNFLLDADGKIIAKNLRGIALHKELDKLVKSL